MTVEIPLTKGYTAIIDDEDAALAQKKWCSSLNQIGQVYAVRNVPKSSNSKGRQVRLHREVMSRVLNRPLTADEYVDHINGDTLLNTRNNLRIVSKHQNTMNRSRNKNNTAGYLGVSSADSSTNPWKAEIRHNGKKIYLGSFPTPELASQAYQAAAVKYFGGYGRNHAAVSGTKYTYQVDNINDPKPDATTFDNYKSAMEYALELSNKDLEQVEHECIAYGVWESIEYSNGDTMLPRVKAIVYGGFVYVRER
jgi:hypothetical protein